MIKLYENVNPNKLVDEIQKEGLLKQEEMSFFPKEDSLEIKFSNIKEISTDVLDDNEQVINMIVTYQKLEKQKLIEVVDGVELPKTIEVWNGFDPTQLFANIQNVIDNHDPTPIPQGKSQLEILQDVVDKLLIDSLGV
ncbi:hypothetical protein [Helicovermis profundi]|uniref:Uncharacterized protein n=1 Tax=Helicovermis profundi TaxID=3065157 RepID=A0AAU9EQR1_9FIRM|nr:hypothetical protein HLPR_11560 [Clostridia bacterium S502]